MPENPLSVCVIGVGPRGLSVLERLCANARERKGGPEVDIHLVDPWPMGAGAVWRTDQSRELLMNTVASQITVFTDDTVTLDGPVEPGPSLFEWAREIVRENSAEKKALMGGEAFSEASRLTADSYPTRAFFGDYLRAMWARVCLSAPPHVTVTAHATRAVRIHETTPGGEQTVFLENGRVIEGLDAVVLAQGHVPARPDDQESRLAAQAEAHGLLYVPPANPADLDHDALAPGEPVLLRGLGLSFFDHMALLTSGRGGRFERRRGRLVYLASGREPRLYATSRRGVPYQARGENQKGVDGRHHPRLFTAERVAALRLRSRHGDGLSFGTDVWPLIARETESVYYGTLLDRRGRGADREAFTELYLAAERADHRVEILDAFGVPEADRWQWERQADPCAGRAFRDHADFTAWLLDHLDEDVRRARGGNVGDPVKAALDVLRDLRNEVRLAVDHGGLDADSHRDELDGWYTPLNAHLSIGPPAFRIEQMRALVEAGILYVTGPGARVHVDGGDPAFVCTASDVPAPPVRTRVLIEARLPAPDLLRTADPLMRAMLEDGQAAPYRVESGGGTRHETGGLAVTGRPGHVVDARNRPHPRRFATGVPTEGAHWVTAAAARPGVDSVSLGDADALARAVLALAARTDRPAADTGRMEVAS
ncbi:FAD/NAD(P)-binding protein [Streptomyces sp. NRRL F-5727]|uniref:FAD/NAD(P)-binding protein n=1 Tax=Streptomyces sp. NRRL F-5727 TaxID=1463871 RepID=UPI000A6C6EFC|nr:FAD/NAD(P)-binding protein [Streptomyces sp. NRRL F-5727]